MKTITSKNTWYFIFGFLVILLISLLLYRSMFGQKQKQLVATPSQEINSNLMVEEKKEVVREISPFASPIPTTTPKLEQTEKTGLALFPNVIEETSVASPIPNKKDSSSPATKSSDLKVINDENGTTYLSTQKNDGTSDTISSVRPQNRVFSLFTLPAGYATDIGSYINDLLRLVMVISALLVFMYLIWGGISWITSGGDKTKVEAARSKIVAAVIGLIIVASSFAILQLVLNFLGFASLNDLLQRNLGRENISLEEKAATTSATIIINESENRASGKTKGGL